MTWSPTKEIEFYIRPAAWNWDTFICKS